MQTITLHDTETEEIIGQITPTEKVDFILLYDTVKESYISFHKTEEFNNGDYSIEDFVEWHNQNNEIKIDWVLNDFIQLSGEDVE